MGGWITISGYCSSGFSPAPSAADRAGCDGERRRGDHQQQQKEDLDAARITDAKALSRTSTRWRMRSTNP